MSYADLHEFNMVISVLLLMITAPAGDTEHPLLTEPLGKNIEYIFIEYQTFLQRTVLTIETALISGVNQSALLALKHKHSTATHKTKCHSACSMKERSATKRLKGPLISLF